MGVLLEERRDLREEDILVVRLRLLSPLGLSKLWKRCSVMARWQRQGDARNAALRSCVGPSPLVRQGVFSACLKFRVPAYSKSRRPSVFRVFTHCLLGRSTLHHTRLHFPPHLDTFLHSSCYAMSVAQEASKNRWKVSVVDRTGKNPDEDQNWVVPEDGKSTVAKLQT